MADYESTQPATQQALDPRRLGEDDLIAEPDQADIICILHPGSPSASRIVQRTAEKRGQHILQNQTAFGETGEIVSLHNSNRSLDLALRFSSTPLQPFGFTFGRNPNMCDIVLKDDTEASKQISNMHFCISVNDNGVLVVEDSSTNGTIVDNVILRSKGHRQGSKRILSNGSTIQPLSRDVENLIIFHVRIPARDGHIARYKANFENFMRKIRQMRADRTDHGDRPEARPVPMSNPTTLVFTSNRFGMKWDGSPKYKVTGFLGRGAFANVYQLTTCYDGELFAVKELEKKRFVKDNILDRRLVNELNIMKAISHESIVNFIEFHDTKDYLYIIMEYVGCGDLQQLLKENQLLTEPQGKALARQTLDALSYLHAKRVTHRDIKPDNILISSMEPFIVKLSDFGLSKEETEISFAKTFCGTLLYCAPEVFPHYNEQQGRKRRHSARQAKYTTAVDIWSLGGVLWFALCGSPPFEGVVDPHGRLMYERITSTRPNVPQLNKKGISGDGQNLLLRMLTIQPEDRPSAMECLADPWLDVGIPPSQYGAELELDPADAVDEEGFSQLSIGDTRLELLDQQHVLADIEEEMDEDMMHLSSKRVKRDERYPRNQIRDNSEPDPETASDQLSEPDPFPPPSTNDQANGLDEGRLFGEIDTAALANSGLLRQHAADALNRDPRPIHRHHRRPTPTGGIAAAGQERTGLMPSAFPSDVGLAEELDIGYSQDSVYSPDYSGQSLNVSVEDLPAIQQERQRQSSGSPNTPREAAPSLISNGTTPRQHRVRSTALENTNNSNEANRPPTALSLRPSPFIGSNGTSQGRYWDNSSQPSQLQWQHKFRANSMPTAFAEDLEANPPLGTLISTTDSFRPLFHRINARATTWGRNPRCTIPHDDTQDLRIPKTSLGIRFEGPGLNMAESTGLDWRGLPGLYVLVKNFSTKHPIWINETIFPPLSSESDDMCGRLHSGDVITILQPRDDLGMISRPADTLRFICDFSVGEARDPRKTAFEIFDFTDSSPATRFSRSGTAGTGTGSDVGPGALVNA